METELSAFHFPELGAKTRGQELLPPWFELEEGFAACSAADNLPDLHMLDDDFFQFAASEFGIEMEEAFVFDLGSGGGGGGGAGVGTGLISDDAYRPLPPENCLSGAPASDSAAHESDMFLTDDVYLIAPLESLGGDDFSITPASSVTASPGIPAVSPPESEVTETTGGAVTTVEIAVAAKSQKEEEEEEEEEEPKPGPSNCKNLVSERNRRKRLSQQLLALRGLVPNITKMDKRSVLVDALAYLRSIHEETARIQTELRERARLGRPEPRAENNPDPEQPHSFSAPPRTPKPKAQILEIDTEKIEERRFVVKITCKGESGVGAEVLRVIESLGFEITYTAIEQIKPQHVLTTVFIRVRRQGRMTEEKLKNSITSTALRSGLTLHNP